MFTGREEYNTGSDEWCIQICVWQQPVQGDLENTAWLLLMDNYEIIAYLGNFSLMSFT